jgi:hypothetical protein
MEHEFRVATAVLARGFRLTSSLKFHKLVRRNRRVQRHIRSQDPSVVINHLVFHEGDFTGFQRLLLRISSMPMRITFIDVGKFFHDFRKHEALPTAVVCPPTRLSERFGAGYKVMCAFWTNEFFRYVESYDAIIRVDDDCYLAAFPAEEIISEMRAGRLDYVTPMLHGADHEAVTLGLADFAERWRRSRSIIEAPRLDTNPYTNVFALRLDAVRHHGSLVEFLSEIRATHCIFQNRWGDLPIWGVVLSMFSAVIRMTVDPRIKYFHGSLGVAVNALQE